MGQIIKFFRSYFFCLVYLIFVRPKVKKMIKHKDRYSIETRYNYFLEKANAVSKLLKIRIEVKGLEHVAHKGPLLFIPNHNSVFDPVILAMVIDDPIVFISKKEAAKKPFFGKCLELIDTLLIDRNNLRQSMQIMNDAKDVINSGRNVCVFPEGTRNKTRSYDLLDFKPGSLKIATDTACPIAPVVIKGTKDIFSSKVKQHYIIKMEFLPTIDPEIYDNTTTLELSKQIYDDMQEKLKNL